MWKKGSIKTSSGTLRSLMLASVLTHSDNRRICGFTFGYAQICSAYTPQTSHILQSVIRDRLRDARNEKI